MLGDVIKDLRNQKHIYQQELADALSVSKSTVAMWETNKRIPDASMLVKIADYFDTTVDYLLESDRTQKESTSIKADRSAVIQRINALPDDQFEKLAAKMEGYLDGLEDQ